MDVRLVPSCCWPRLIHPFAIRYTPITEREFFDTIFVPIYEPDSAPSDATASHRLALLYMVLATGALLDLDRPPNNPDSMHYYQLGRAALSLESVLDEPSFTAAQALVSKLSCYPMSHLPMPPSWL